MFQAACLQFSVLADRAQQQEKIIQMITDAAEQGNQLIVLPELHNTPYFCQVEDPSYFDWAEPIPGPSCEILSQLAKQYQIVIVASLFERRAPGLYHNTAVVFDRDGSMAGKYRKMHIPDDPGYYEKYYFTPGDLGFTPVKTSLGRLGVLICWDQWFPEAARLMALQGADLLIYPTAIGWDKSDPYSLQQQQLDAWETIQRAHAIANGLPCLVCNRTGFEPHPTIPHQGTQFWGKSFIAGTQGQILARATSAEEDQWITAQIDLSEIEQIRRAWPYFRDRRTDRYDLLLKQYQDFK